MSSTQWNIRVSAPSGFRTIHGVGLTVESGDLSESPSMQVERLITPSVDGVRLRERGLQFEPVTIVTYEPFASYGAARGALASLQKIVAKPVDIIVKIDSGIFSSWKDARILPGSTGSIDGKIAGFGAITGGVASIRYKLIIQRIIAE